MSERPISSEAIGINEAEFSEAFPNPESFDLAKKYIARATTVPSVVRIATLRLAHGPRLFVFVEGEYGIPEMDDMMTLYDMYREVCPTKEDVKLLNVAPPITESSFQDDRVEIAGLKDIPVVTLWQRPTISLN
jgi:hypothetical protein